MVIRDLPEYIPWRSMIRRCENENYAEYHLYGGAGVKVCDEWRHSFKSFVDHIGPRPSAKHSIDRIDNSKGYEPGNVHWATAIEQARNRSCVIFVSIGYETKCVAEWCVIYGIARSTVANRLKSGWDILEAITTPSIAPRRISADVKSDIRAAYKTGLETHRSLASKFNISKRTIELVLKEVA